MRAFLLCLWKLLQTTLELWGDETRVVSVSYFCQVSRNVTVRLNTGLPGWLSLRSATK